MNMILQNENACPLQICTSFLNGKWKILIIHRLLCGNKRYNSLLREIDGISSKVLTEQLNSLMADNMVRKEIFTQVPVKCEYSLTEFGKTLAPVVKSMYDWGTDYLEGQPQQAI